MRAGRPVALALLLASSACGARTSLATVSDDDGSGGASAASGAGGDGSTTAAGGGAEPRCRPETFGGPGTAGAQRIEADATHAYWTTVDGRLVRAAFGGGPEEELLGGLVDVGDLALDGDRVVLAAGGRIVALPTGGGGPPTVLAEDVEGVVTIVADDSGLYWMSGGSGIASYALTRLAPDGTRTELVSSIGFGLGVALTASHVVFTADTLPGFEALGLVARVPKEGGEVELLASERPDPTNVMVRGDDLFWTEQLDFRGGPVGVVRLASGAATPVRVLTAPAGALPLLGAVTSDTVVMTALDVERGAMLLAAPIDGGDAVLLAEDDGFFLEPVAARDRIAMTVQPAVGEPGDTSDVEVRVLCP